MTRLDEIRRATEAAHGLAPDPRTADMLHLLSLVDDLAGALREIEKGEGRFSVDHKTHAINTIDDMKELARAALARLEESNG